MPGFVPALTVSALLEGLELLGHDARGLMKSVGIRYEDLALPNAIVPDPAYPRLWLEARERFGSKSIGSEVGQAVPFGALGVMDYVFSTARTLEEAIDHMSSLNHLVSGGDAYWEIETLEKSAFRLAFVNEDSFDEQTTSDEFALSLVLGRVRNATAGNLDIREVQLTTRNSTKELSHILNCNVSFGHSRAGIVLPSNALNLPMKRQDPRLNGVLWGLMRDSGYHAGNRPSLYRSVRTSVRDCFAKGKVSELSAIARQYGMSDRTLQRHLRKEGCEFEAIVDEVRKEKALQLIQDQRRSILSISLDLGFSNERSLARAFRRWTGSSPSQYRQQNRMLTPIGTDES
jgi:AraC-like DNA-binding protein